MFVQPRLDLPAPRPPDRGEPSDRIAWRARRSARRSPRTRCRSRAATRRSASSEPPQAAARGQGPAPDPPAGQRRPRRSRSRDAQPPQAAGFAVGAAAADRTRPPTRTARTVGRRRSGGRSATRSATCSATCSATAFDNPQGGGGQFGPEIQFDTKGVEFGPWIRRFIAQVKRNWFMPYAAMSMKGHVVITFNVHKDGSITDLTVVGPCPIDAFNNAAFGALAARTRRSRCRRSIPSRRRSSPSRSSTTNSRRGDADRTQQLGLLILLRRRSSCYVVVRLRAMKPLVVADPRADRDRQERARAGAGRAASAARSSTAIRRRSIAASTSAPTRCRVDERRGIPHHLIDIADPTEEYTAAQYARDAARSIRDIHARGRLPIRRRRHRLLLPRADARPVSRARARTRRCARGSKRSPTRRGVDRFCTGMLRARRSGRRRRASSRAI